MYVARSVWAAIVGLLMLLPPHAQGQQEASGSIRGVVFDADFDVPLAGAAVEAVELGLKAVSSDLGNYVFAAIQPGTYTLVFSKDGYVRQVRANVVVTAGQLTDVNVRLAGEFTDMEEVVVEDILAGGGGSELALLELRFESPALLDSIGSELMSRAGASDAASALRLVSGATVQDGKFAVIRGLPDRYVTSQVNGVRMPSADENTRAVELDQFPSAVIESVQVSKTFTPDQQGDASGGAVDVRIRGVPEESTLQISGQLGYNSEAGGRDDFLSYDGGGLDYWGKDESRAVQTPGTNWDGAVGVSRREAPQDYKWSVAGGGKLELAEDVRVGGFASVFYERDSYYYKDGVSNALWVQDPNVGIAPEESQGSSQQGSFLTGLFDFEEASQSVQWGNLAVAGIESENHALTLTYLYTRTAEDKAILAEDTRGKEFFFPGHDPFDPSSPGSDTDSLDDAPYLRTETLEYTERTTSSTQLSGQHKLGEGGYEWDGLPTFGKPELSWTASYNTANLYQPDKRQFGSVWQPATAAGPFIFPALFLPYKPAENFELGNLQRIFKEIGERSNQYTADLTLPFERDDTSKGYVKLGAFSDETKRRFDQDTFSNFNDNGAEFEGEFDEFWSASFPFELTHPITESTFDVDYEGEQRIRAAFVMLDQPLTTRLNIVGGVRFESTELGITNFPEEDATWFPLGQTAAVELNPGDADVDFSQDDVLPSIGLIYRPSEPWTVRASYTQTVARQTFKELSPIIQQEFLGGPIFVGNPDLQMSALDNWDLRVDYTPNPGGLLSASVFYKDIEDAIEFVQAEVGQLTFTSPQNYPEGRMLGFELEGRQQLGEYVRSLSGLGVGANATFIDAEVTLPEDEVETLEGLGQFGLEKRDMTNAPEYLLNLFATYDIESTGTQFGLFYTLTGDTLVAGAGESKSSFIPSVYARAFGSLSATISQPLGRYFRLQLNARNITDPDIKEVYRYRGEDYTRTSYSRGVDYSATLSARFTF